MANFAWNYAFDTQQPSWRQHKYISRLTPFQCIDWLQLRDVTGQTRYIYYKLTNNCADEKLIELPV